MSAVLRAYGEDFDVNSFLAGCTLPICAVKRRGEPVLPDGQPNGRRHDRSGVHVLVSGAGFDHFDQQVADAIEFLHKETDQLERLRDFPGVENAELDFGIERRDAAVQCDCFPPALTRLAGSLGLGIMLSQYPIERRVKSR